MAFENNICLKAVHTAGKKNISRDSQSNRQMVPEQISCGRFFFLPLGSPFEGSICDISEQENTSVLFTSCCNRCNCNLMTEHVTCFPVPFPPLQMILKMLQHVKH